MQCIRLNHEINKMCSDVPFPREWVLFSRRRATQGGHRAGALPHRAAPCVITPQVWLQCSFPVRDSEDCMVLHSPFRCFRGSRFIDGWINQINRLRYWNTNGGRQACMILSIQGYSANGGSKSKSWFKHGVPGKQKARLKKSPWIGRTRVRRKTTKNVLREARFLNSIFIFQKNMFVQVSQK